MPKSAMYRSIRWLILLLILAACRETRSGSERGEAPDVAAGSGGAEREGSGPGLEFEAPRLIPAIRAQITEIKNPRRATEGNLTAFRNGVGTLVNAMEADLNRAGTIDSGYFYLLSDSIMREMRGGPGDVASIPTEKAPQAAAQVERLIKMYEERMRKPAN